MAKSVTLFELDDAGTFDENLDAFGQELARLDAVLGPVLRAQIEGLLDQTKTRADVWNALAAALPKAPQK